VYGRTSSSQFRGRDSDASKYQNPDNDPRGPWTSENLTGLASSAERPNLHYDIVDPATGVAYPPSLSRGWGKSLPVVERLVSEGRILFPAKSTGRPREKKFLNDLQSHVTGFSTWLTSETVGYNYTATREVRDLLGGKLFDFPKPVGLLEQLCEQVTSENDLVLDFFAGSSTTADAVNRINSRDGSNRRFVMVQLPEAYDLESEAAKAGYETIAELSKERIRRSGAKVLEGDTHAEWNKDVGFRVLKIDTTNMTDILRTPDHVEQAQMFEFTDSVKAGRTGEDLLFQVLLDWGLELSMPIAVEQIAEQQVFVVEGDALIACFDDKVSAEVVTAIAKRQPLRAVFRDSGFASDADRINAEQIFTERSPATDVKTV
jgi:adenine-specific DNA-methyltransferase